MCWRTMIAVLLVIHGEVDERLEVRLEVADVVPLLLPREAHRVDGLALVEEYLDGIGYLELAALLRDGAVDGLEYLGAKDVARGDGEVAGGLLRRGLLNEPGDLEDVARLGLAFGSDNSVMVDEVRGTSSTAMTAAAFFSAKTRIMSFISVALP